MDNIKFFGKPHYNSNYLQFGQCEFPKTWAESRTTYPEGSSIYPEYDTENAQIVCNLDNESKLLNLSYTICEDEKDHPGRNSNVTAILKNGKDEGCTMPLQHSDSDKKTVTIDAISEACKDIIFTREIGLWIVNDKNDDDGICLTDFALSTQYEERSGEFPIILHISQIPQP